MPFPTLMQGNPAPDPGEFTAAAASVRNALHAAANQQAEQKRLADKDAQAQAQKDFADRIQMAKLGATQDTESSGSTHPNGPTLKLGDQNPDSVTQARKGATIKDPQGGGDWYVPTAEEKATKKAANDPENFVPTGQLGAALQAGGGWDGKKAMTPAQSHALMQSINIAQEQLKGEPFHIDLSGKFTGPDGKPAGVLIGEKTGKVRMLDLSGMNGAPAQPGAAGPATPGAATGGPFDTSQAQSVAPGDTVDMQNRTQSPGYGFSPKQGAPGVKSPGASPNGAFTFKLPDKPEKEPRKETADDWVRIMTDPASDPKEVTRATAALKLWRAPGTEADKDRHAAAADRAGDRAERKQERAETADEKKKATFRGIETVKRKALAEAQKTYRKSLETAIDPESKKAAAEQLRSDVNDAQNEYESSIGDETGNKISHNDWAKGVAKDTPAAKDTPKTTAKPAQPVAAKAVTHEAPPASVTKGLAPGTHTFGNGQVWKKGADGSMVYVSGGQ